MYAPARVALTIALALGAVPLLGVGEAAACSCAGPDDEASFARADAVFSARLPGNDRLGRAARASQVTVTFTVDRVYKGTVRALQPVNTAASGASCGLELEGSGPFLVYTHFREPGQELAYGPEDELQTGLCDGNRPLTAAEPTPFGAGTAPLPAAEDAEAGVVAAEGSGDLDLGPWGPVVALAGGAALVAVVLAAHRRRNNDE